MTCVAFAGGSVQRRDSPDETNTGIESNISRLFSLCQGGETNSGMMTVRAAPTRRPLPKVLVILSFVPVEIKGLRRDC